MRFSKRWLARLAAIPLFATTFGLSYAVASTRATVKVGDALQAVGAGGPSTVCLGAVPCVDPRAEYTMFVFFSERDCLEGLYQVAMLERAYREVPRSRLNVVGVASGFTPDQAVKFARASQITYPLYLDAARMARFVADPRPAGVNRPVSLLVSHGGRVVMEASIAPASVARHEERVSAVVRRVQGP